MIRRYLARSQSSSTAGLTLVELLLGSALTTTVLSIVFTGVLSAINANRLAEVRTNRRIDLTRAFDFISNEIRMASRINQSATTVANGSSVTVEDVVTSSGLNLSELGSYDTIVLYLEVPIPSTGVVACADGSTPAAFDRVVYDIRPSASDWLPPMSIRRYGRLPELDGSVDPCGTPTRSDTLVDAISAQATTQPTCAASGQLVGAAGFQACVDGAQVDLFLESDIAGVESRELNSTASSRLSHFLPAPRLSGSRIGETVEFSWTWTGPPGATFQLYETVDGNSTEIYSGTDLNTTVTLSGGSGLEHCYTLIANTPTYSSPESNQVCETQS